MEQLDDKWDVVDVEEFGRCLEKEAGIFEALRLLQGTAVPVLYGRWKVGSHFVYAYEDAGTAVSWLCLSLLEAQLTP